MRTGSSRLVDQPIVQYVIEGALRDRPRVRQQGPAAGRIDGLAGLIQSSLQPGGESGEHFIEPGKISGQRVVSKLGQRGRAQPIEVGLHRRPRIQPALLRQTQLLDRVRIDPIRLARWGAGRANSKAQDVRINRPALGSRFRDPINAVARSACRCLPSAVKKLRIVHDR